MRDLKDIARNYRKASLNKQPNQTNSSSIENYLIKLLDNLDKLKGEKGIQGEKGNDGINGYTPKKGLDYFTKEDIEDVVKLAKPSKGVDYFTKKDIEAFKKDITPVKGKDYFDGLNGKDGKNGIDGAKGIDGKDGTLITGIEIRDKLQNLPENEKLETTAIKGLAQYVRKLQHSGISSGAGGGSDSSYFSLDEFGNITTNNKNIIVPFASPSVDWASDFSVPTKSAIYNWLSSYDSAINAKLNANGGVALNLTVQEYLFFDGATGNTKDLFYGSEGVSKFLLRLTSDTDGGDLVLKRYVLLTGDVNPTAYDVFTVDRLTGEITFNNNIHAPNLTGGSASSEKYNQILTGTKNGINTVFTTPDNFVTASTRFFVNGQRLQLGNDYTETGLNEVTLALAPQSSDILIIDYSV